jgi:LysM repeat protein
VYRIYKVLKLKKTLLIGILVIQSVVFVFANGNGTKNTRQDYIDRWKIIALQNMFEYNIPASITLAQGILESGNGNSTLTKKANNHFGIKCHGWDGPGYYMDDDKKDECFRVYKNAEDSFEDHSQFLLKKRYANLFTLKPTDYKGWAKGLKKAGYATNPEYAKRLISIIEDNKLYKYDKYTFNEYLELKGNSKYAKTDDVLIVEDNAPKKRHKSNSKVVSDELVYTMGRKIHVHPNKINYVIAKEGDDYGTIAKDVNLSKWQITNYNDVEKTDKIEVGDIIFIQAKKSKSKTKSYTSKRGDTWWSVSQEFGIKLKKLLKKNGVPAGQVLKPGQKIILR